MLGTMNEKGTARLKRVTIVTVFFSIVAGAAVAEDVALVIGNGNYDRMRDVRRGGQVVQAAGALKDAGVVVLSQEDAKMRAMAGLAGQFAQAARNADGVIVVLSGRFVNSGTETYFLPTDIRNPELASISSEAMPLSAIEAMLAKVPGRAILVLASDGDTGQMGPYLNQGIGTIEAPQGVTIVQTEPEKAANFIESVLAVEDAEIVTQADHMRGITVSGYKPDTLRFLASQSASPAPAPAPARNSGSDDEGYWNAVRDIDTVEAYQSYLDRYPDGQHAKEARQIVTGVRAEPNRDARVQEENLGLSRDQRREIQRNLSILDYNTRGIDGIFGKGTRAAIGAWQQKNGYDATGFLTREQIGALKVQADKRAAELQAQAERRKAEQERADEAYWRETGAVGDEAGYRAYLKRYHDGKYAEVATARLAEIEKQRRDSIVGQERQLWERVSNQDTVEAYDSYLSKYPKGSFAAEARARRDELVQEQQNAKAMESAKAAEDRLGMNAATRTIIEQRLNALGLKPGAIDGVFDERTRRAIRRFQNERGMEVTGYVNQAVVVRILAESILR